MTARVRVQTADFDVAQEIQALRAQDLRVGAVCSFVGTVRDTQALTGLHHDEVQAMELEHYPGMTEKSLEEIIEKAKVRWDIFDVLIIHRVGPLNIEDQIVLTAVTSAHRGEAFAACEYVMDYLKTLAPFWKKEDTPEGARWVDARLSDDEALKKWQ